MIRYWFLNDYDAATYAARHKTEYKLPKQNVKSIRKTLSLMKVRNSKVKKFKRSECQRYLLKFSWLGKYFQSRQFIVSLLSRKRLI